MGGLGIALLPAGLNCPRTPHSAHPGAGQAHGTTFRPEMIPKPTRWFLQRHLGPVPLSGVAVVGTRLELVYSVAW